MRPERALARLHGLPLNFDEGSVPRPPVARRRAQPGPARRAAGEPVPGGAWQVARRLVEDYRIADPAIVRASWDPGAPLEGRDMLLELRLYRVLRVHAGVRVTRAWDEPRRQDGRRARVFGFEYATLDGHIEMGRMDYEVWKWTDDGAVEFRLHAVSRASGQGPAWTRLGFRLFGRREQLRFYLPLLRAHRKADRARARPARRPAAARRPRARGRPRPHGRARGKPAPAQLRRLGHPLGAERGLTSKNSIGDGAGSSPPKTALTAGTTRSSRKASNTSRDSQTATTCQCPSTSPAAAAVVAAVSASLQ